MRSPTPAKKYRHQAKIGYQRRGAIALKAHPGITDEELERDLLPVGYFHVVFTLPAEVAEIAWQNKSAVYDQLFKAASETMMTIAADPRHLGARIGITAMLHTWGSAMTHHPHVHMIVPGGGISPDGMRWVASRAAFLLPVRVLSRLFRRRFLAVAVVEGLAMPALA